MTTLIIVNAVFMFLTVLAVYAVTVLAHRLPETAPLDDESWGLSGDSFVPSEPLPLRQVTAHETRHELARAA